MGFRQTPLIKEPQQPGRLGERAFLTFEDAKSGAPAVPVVATGDTTSALASLLTQIISGGSAMDPAVIIQLINALSKSSQPAPRSKGFGDLLPIILPLILKSAAPTTRRQGPHRYPSRHPAADPEIGAAVAGKAVRHRRRHSDSGDRQHHHLGHKQGLGSSRQAIRDRRCDHRTRTHSNCRGGSAPLTSTVRANRRDRRRAATFARAR